MSKQKVEKTGPRTKTAFGAWLEEARVSKGLTREELAAKAGLGGGPTIYRIVNGEREPYLGTAKALAEALGITGNEMFEHYDRIPGAGPQPKRRPELLTPQEIRDRRETAGLTQMALADHIGVAWSSYRKWEIGSLRQSSKNDRRLRRFFATIREGLSPPKIPQKYGENAENSCVCQSGEGGSVEEKTIDAEVCQ